jgi:hypothetical protein
MFKLDDPNYVKRLEEFKTDGDDDLTDEIALMKLLAEIATNSGRYTLAGMLLHNVGKLQLLKTAQEERRGNLLSRRALFEVGSAICDTIKNHFAGLPEDEYCRLVDAIVPAIRTAVENAGREKPLSLVREEP